MPGKEPPIERAGRSRVGLEMGRIDHQFLGLAAAHRKPDEEAPEQAQCASERTDGRLSRVASSLAARRPA